MTWPDTYKDRYEAAQRALRVISKHLRNFPNEWIEQLGRDLAADPEAIVELAEANNALESLTAAAEAVDATPILHAVPNPSQEQDGV